MCNAQNSDSFIQGTSGTILHTSTLGLSFQSARYYSRATAVDADNNSKKRRARSTVTKIMLCALYCRLSASGYFCNCHSSTLFFWEDQYLESYK